MTYPLNSQSPTQSFTAAPGDKILMAVVAEDFSFPLTPVLTVKRIERERPEPHLLRVVVETPMVAEEEPGTEVVMWPWANAPAPGPNETPKILLSQTIDIPADVFPPETVLTYILRDDLIVKVYCTGIEPPITRFNIHAHATSKLHLVRVGAN